MPLPDETVEYVLSARSWDERVARVRLIPSRHGTDDHAAIYARIGKIGYVPHLAPDFAYVHGMDFYDLDTFEAAYAMASDSTSGFASIDVDTLSATLAANPSTLLVFRSITGLGRNEFAASTELAAELCGLKALSAAKVDSMERIGSPTNEKQARIAAETIVRIMDGSLFGAPSGDLRSKQEKPDTVAGWSTVRQFARDGVPYSVLLHQRHYGGSFRQLLDATSERRGDLLEDAVEALFVEHGIPHIRTGSHNHGSVSERFEVSVSPSPDFVVYDEAGVLRALLECKGANDGGTARDKALRFERLADEARRLGGIPLIAVLGGLGWKRVNDTLGPVIRDCGGRVFTLSNLHEMLTLAPLLGLSLQP